MTTTDNYRISSFDVARLLDLHLEISRAEILAIAEYIESLRKSLAYDSAEESYSSPGFDRSLRGSQVIATSLRDLANRAEGAQRLQERMPW